MFPDIALSPDAYEQIHSKQGAKNHVTGEKFGFYDSKRWSGFGHNLCPSLKQVRQLVTDSCTERPRPICDNKPCRQRSAVN
jgi:hypothetical protein